MTCHCIRALRAAPAAKDFARSHEDFALQARTSTSLSWIMSGASPRTSRRCATRWVTSTIASPSSTRPCTCTSTRPAASSVTRRTTCTRRCGRPRPPLSLASAAAGDSLRLPPPKALPDEITLAKEPPLAPLQLSCIALNTQPAPDPRIAGWTLPTPLSVRQHGQSPPPPPQARWARLEGGGAGAGSLLPAPPPPQGVPGGSGWLSSPRGGGRPH